MIQRFIDVISVNFKLLQSLLTIQLFIQCFIDLFSFSVRHSFDMFSRTYFVVIIVHFIHDLYWHVSEHHNSNIYSDHGNPKNLSLLYMMRCSDLTFALCMDPSEPKTTTLISTTKMTNQQTVDSPAIVGKQKLQQKTKQRTSNRQHPRKKTVDNGIIRPSTRPDIIPQVSSLSIKKSLRLLKENRFKYMF